MEKSKNIWLKIFGRAPKVVAPSNLLQSPVGARLKGQSGGHSRNSNEHFLRLKKSVQIQAGRFGFYTRTKTLDSFVDSVGCITRDEQILPALV
jgi:hypothetical protein